MLASDWPEQANWLRARGLEPERLNVTQVVGEELATAAARQGLGLGVEDLALVQDDIDAGRLVVLLDEGEALPAYFVVTPPGPQRAATRVFLSWLLRQA